MDLRKFDLNLLLVLDALFQDRSVTLAAQRLGISQPTVSAALNRLRAVFQDDLFVKTPRGVEPTQLAHDLAGVVSEILDTVHNGVLNRGSFNPTTTERTFRLIAGELGQLVFVDRLLPAFRRLAPRARIQIIYSDPQGRTSALEDGRADLAMGYFPQFARTTLYQQLLYSRSFALVARADHPVLCDGELTCEKLARLQHVTVAMRSNLNAIVESELRRRGIPHDVVIELSHAAGAEQILSSSDLIAVLSEPLANIYCRSGKLSSWPLPFDIPRYEVKQYWHRRAHRDPGVRWLRKLIATEFQATAAAPEPGAETLGAEAGQPHAL